MSIKQWDEYQDKKETLMDSVIAAIHDTTDNLIEIDTALEDQVEALADQVLHQLYQDVSDEDEEGLDFYPDMDSFPSED